MNAADLSAFRGELQGSLELTWPASIVLAGVPDPIPAARGRSTAGADPELTGFLPTADLTLRVRRAEIPPGVVFEPRQTRLSESGKDYRVEEVVDEKSDPAIVLHCKAL